MKARFQFGVMFLALALGACGGGGDDEPAAAAQSVNSVTLSASGTGPLDVTFVTASGGISQQHVASGSFSTSFLASPGDFLSISAQTGSSFAAASVTTTITVNGKTLKSTSSVGPFVVASASGTCC